MIIGEGEFRYEYVERWCRLPDGWAFGADTTSVAADSHDRVYVCNRSEHPVMVFDRDGQFLRSFGEGDINRPHGITLAADDTVYCTDDLTHVVHTYSKDGKLLQIIGTRNQPSDTGYDKSAEYPLTTIKRAAGPFNRPTKAAWAENGDIYVCDGYGNARVHRFTAAGDLIQSWGEPGDGPGQFNVPHSVWVHTDGRLFVADRENSRIQIFSPTGELLGGWRTAGRPLELAVDKENHMFISELNTVAGKRNMAGIPFAETVPTYVCVRDLEGNLLARLGGVTPGELDSFFTGHGMCLDSHGDMYVAENVASALAKLGISRPDYPAVRKFVRI